LGGIVKSGLIIELLIAPNAVTRSLREATIVEVYRQIVKEAVAMAKNRGVPALNEYQ
jgi:hypothetical protein